MPPITAMPAISARPSRSLARSHWRDAGAMASQMTQVSSVLRQIRETAR